jgi:hypothetical protein
VKEQRTTSNQGRLLRRSFHESYLQRVHGYRDTPAFKRAMRKRSAWVEGLFAEAKQWHGLHRFRLRGLANLNIQALFVAAGQNLKRWLQATDWGQRGFPGTTFAPSGCSRPLECLPDARSEHGHQLRGRVPRPGLHAGRAPLFHRASSFVRQCAAVLQHQFVGATA